MFGAATNTNKLCIATGGPVLASGEHVTGGLVAARHCSRPVDRPAPTDGSVERAAVCINSLRIVFFLTLHQVSSPHQISAKCTHAHDAGASNDF